MLLHELVSASNRIAATSSRLKKIDTLSRLLLRIPPYEIAAAVNYLTASLPRGKIGIGPSRLFRLNEPAAPTPTLTVSDLDGFLAGMESLTGPGSSAARDEALSELFRKATAEEQDFLVRLLVGELRQGALEGVMLEALARAAHLPASELRRRTMLAGDLGSVALRLFSGAGEAPPLTVFQPVAPMLAQPAADLDDALRRLGEADLQWKLDGARIQLHKERDVVRVYSRSLNEVSAAVPEIVEGARGFAAESLILDGEAIALRSDGSPHPFQTTMRRFGRRLEVEAARSTLPLSPFYFDCLYLDGETLIDLPQRERFRRMAAILPPEQVIPHLVTGDPGEAAAFLADVLARGHEGVMAKGCSSAYEAGRRGHFWLKVKPVQTLDLVVLAAEWGHGRRKGMLSNLHLGARDGERAGFAMLGKTFKGLTDAMLAWQTERLLELELSRDSYTVYVAPELVVEIAFSDLQASPRYPAGLALRFARVKRFRPDKSAQEADTLETVRSLYRGG